MTGAAGAAVAASLSEDEPGPPVTVPRQPAQDAAERELSDQRYAEHEPGPLRRAFDWVWDRVWDTLDSVALYVPGGWLGLVIIGLVVLALVVALRLRLGPLRGTTRPGRDTALFASRPRDAAEHRAAAMAHAGAQRWDEAVRERMRAIVRSLEERDVLDPRPGRTADESAAEAGGAMPGLAARLRAAARTFDAVTYGGHHASADDHAQLRDLDEELRHTKPTLSGATSDSSGTAATTGRVQ